MQPIRPRRAPKQVVPVDDLFRMVEERQEAEMPSFAGYRIAIPTPKTPPRARKRRVEGRPNS